MNKDINFTLAALVPVLRMNGEKVASIEAVQDWYKANGREYCKEVAEITYEDGYQRYADIGCDSNLTACYDILAVVQEIKPKSAKIERIVRDIYEKPKPEKAQKGRRPDAKCGSCAYLDLEDRSTIGFECHRPNHNFRSCSASRKYKTTPACVDYRAREEQT